MSVSTVSVDLIPAVIHSVDCPFAHHLRSRLSFIPPRHVSFVLSAAEPCGTWMAAGDPLPIGVKGIILDWLLSRVDTLHVWVGDATLLATETPTLIGKCKKSLDQLVFWVWVWRAALSGHWWQPSIMNFPIFCLFLWGTFLWGTS